jgi:ATP-dependent DNA helicase RecG
MNDILEQIKNGENKTVEFKKTLPKNDSIAKTVIAFSNTSGGKLIVGINDKREVARVFKELGYIEQWGSGLVRMNELCRAANIQEPKTKESGDFFDIEFVRPITDDKVSDSVIKPSDTNDYERLRTITNDYERLAKEEQEILLYLLDNKTISRKEATTLIGLKNTKTYEILNSLVEKNLIARDGQGRSTYYKLKKAVGDE